ncbi:hypothetical protein NTE_00565 [Candidatus Nitrososphaera evergladensis SR1]|uniref:Uncharacterized protein n=1 Tax=Candidatus Nitrososphaera evergladensis SR1 TaxID=1459636 RepID=A0A075MME6_9ARCH|nr:hypothetical protein NTE_00565 [Candidatus Nitrososphaera evergladensis SR1]
MAKMGGMAETAWTEPSALFLACTHRATVHSQASERLQTPDKEKVVEREGGQMPKWLYQFILMISIVEIDTCISAASALGSKARF